MYEQSAELREDYTDHYGRITEIDKLADEFEGNILQVVIKNRRSKNTRDDGLLN